MLIKPSLPSHATSLHRLVARSPMAMLARSPLAAVLSGSRMAALTRPPLGALLGRPRLGGLGHCLPAALTQDRVPTLAKWFSTPVDLGPLRRTEVPRFVPPSPAPPDLAGLADRVMALPEVQRAIRDRRRGL